MISTTKFCSSLNLRQNLSSSPGTVNTLNPVSGQEVGQSLVCSFSQRVLKLKPRENDSILKLFEIFGFHAVTNALLKVNETDHESDVNKYQPLTVSVAFVFDTCKVTSSITGL